MRGIDVIGRTRNNSPIGFIGSREWLEIVVGLYHVCIEDISLRHTMYIAINTRP